MDDVDQVLAAHERAPPDGNVALSLRFSDGILRGGSADACKRGDLGYREIANPVVLNLARDHYER